MLWLGVGMAVGMAHAAAMVAAVRTVQGTSDGGFNSDGRKAHPSGPRGTRPAAGLRMDCGGTCPFSPVSVAGKILGPP